MKITFCKKEIVILIVFLLCIALFFLGKKYENNFINNILDIAFEKHNKYYGEQQYTIENICIYKEKYIIVRFILKDADKIMQEEQAFNCFGQWRGCDIVEITDD
ncbi:MULTISPECIES: hypothetical protein [unclassified Treponema]|uniref:hypothetical protein n=1 Tax=unclassified Treponema TaxID=2638727 RepID=UPI0020A5FB99|nr:MULTISPECIES: hypothetical protein [unclassified Treponema]UTC67914.1 hypothetical protein E4O06_04500 [Treponema sp. OMZ 789]UTC70635.1 hypothetical protein E4O01_04490 [Treponema sp. OMZ 790]UTC73359.1 hypothetical protein E4O02_04735 [Treponema sp. OMZ 791]